MVMSKMDENQMAPLTEVLTCEASAPFDSASAFDRVKARTGLKYVDGMHYM